MPSPSYVGGEAAPGGIWRWAALALFLIALAAAGLAVATAGAAGWSGVALLAGIGSVRSRCCAGRDLAVGGAGALPDRARRGRPGCGNRRRGRVVGGGAARWHWID